jgi:hypothetical protein
MTDDPQPDKSAGQHLASNADAAGESLSGSPRSIVPLVLIPLLMVAAFVIVIALFGWLGLAGDRPEELVARLQRADRGSFRAAVALVQMLREPENSHLRRDEQLARQLSRLLQDELASGNLEPERIQLRSFLCRALGELEGDEVLSPLLDAGATERDAREIDVRRSAFEAIAQIAARLSAERRSNVPGLLDTVLAATQSSPEETLPSPSRDALRATAAFTLGVLGDDRAQTALLHLLDDPCADVRFNAATGLGAVGTGRVGAGSAGDARSRVRSGGGRGSHLAGTCLAAADRVAQRAAVGRIVEGRGAPRRFGAIAPGRPASHSLS